ncbi:hypothetical protein FBUS_01047 [Fasciolopsis buskii]|uniref:C2 domain-containing protein n=1 Tax=Fasciolopsis buskii TaxID=27845 RepID=A0A8E0RY70_9TREM|nr:hypothetical protein FBUS_01047 [Fasciolopsis buski]
MTIWIVRRPHMRGVIACLIVAYNTPETVKPVTVSSFDQEEQQQTQSAKARTTGGTNAQPRERVTWYQAARTVKDGNNRNSNTERLKSAVLEKSHTLTLAEGNAEKARLVRQVTVQDSAEILNESAEESPETDKNQKPHKSRRKSYSVSLSRLNSYSSENEAEASYQTHVEVQGDLEVSLDYDKESSRLAVMVWGARNIAAADKKGHTSHPYARVFLFPDPTNKTERKIHCKGHTCSPTFNQGVCYNVSPSDILEKTLVVELWHKRKSRGSKIFLGEISIVLRNHKWDKTEKQRMTLESKHTTIPAIMESAYRGELKIGLKFSMSQSHQLIAQMKEGETNFPGMLQVAIREARNLISSAAGLNVCAFVRGEIRLEQYQNESHQTDVYPKSSHPVWNTVFQFPNLTQSDLYKAVLELSVWHRTVMTKTPQMLGGVRLCYKGCKLYLLSGCVYRLLFTGQIIVGQH